MKYIKSPVNYIGGKTKLLNQILPKFPKNINNFVDLFAGGCNVGINVNAKKIYFNDNLTYLIELFQFLKENEFDLILDHITNRINEFELTITNEVGYNRLRTFYNHSKHPLDLFVLISFSFNHQIRFNNNHEFNNPFGKNRSCFNTSIKYNLEKFINKLKQQNIEFTNSCFTEFDFRTLTENDFVYCDPPYLITTGTYNDGKRGFKGWTKEEEIRLLDLLENLNKKKTKFALSNVIKHKGKSNTILLEWLESNSKFTVSPLNYDYSNSNYQTLIRDKSSTLEVLITNYEPEYVNTNISLFESTSLI